MKKEILLPFVALLAAFALAGCGNGDDNDAHSQANIMRVAENIDWSKAPTLRDLADKATRLIFAEKWAELWDMLGSPAREDCQKALDEEKKNLPNIDAQIRELEQKMQQAPDNLKPQYQAAIDVLKLKKEKIPSIQTAKDFFIFAMGSLPFYTEVRKGLIEDFVDRKAEVTGEEFFDEGNSGKVLIKTPDGKSTSVYDFAKENGEWKLTIGEGKKDEKTDDTQDGGATDGGGVGTLAELIERAFAKMKFERAPVLAGIAKEAYRALAAPDWDWMWNNLSAAERANIEKAMAQEKPGSDPAGLKDYFIGKMQSLLPPVIIGVRQELTHDGLEVVGETIAPDGKSGSISVKNLKTGVVTRGLSFINDNGDWRLDFAPFVRPPIA